VGHKELNPLPDPVKEREVGLGILKDGEEK